MSPKLDLVLSRREAYGFFDTTSGPPELVSVRVRCAKGLHADPSEFELVVERPHQLPVDPGNLVCSQADEVSNFPHRCVSSLVSRGTDRSATS
jgi:hypothetical protein